MLGSLIGDLVASRYVSGMRPEDDELLCDECELTTGSLLTVCAMKAITESEGADDTLTDETAFWSAEIVSQYGGDEASEGAPADAGFVAGPCGIAALDEDGAARLTCDVMEGLVESAPTGIRAENLAIAVTVCASGLPKEEIAEKLSAESFGFREAVDLRDRAGARNLLRDDAGVCAVAAFLKGDDFVGVLREAVKLSGGRPSACAAAGALAEAFYGVPDDMEEKAREMISRDFLEILDAFNEYVLTVRAKL